MGVGHGVGDGISAAMCQHCSLISPLQAKVPTRATPVHAYKTETGTRQRHRLTCSRRSMVSNPSKDLISRVTNRVKLGSSSTCPSRPHTNTARHTHCNTPPTEQNPALKSNSKTLFPHTCQNTSIEVGPLASSSPRNIDRLRMSRARELRGSRSRRRSTHRPQQTRALPPG